MDKLQGSILIVDDDSGVLQTAKFILKQQFTHVDVEKDPRRIPFKLKQTPYDVVLLDMNYQPGETSGNEGLDWLQKIRTSSPETGVVMMTAYGEIGLAVEAMKKGAVDFIVKPWQNEKFIATVTSVLQLSQSRKEIKDLKILNKELHDQIKSDPTAFIGESQKVVNLKELIQKVAPTEASILVQGENGTGKELIAQMIHDQSQISNQPFVKVDLGAIPSTLFESELFGHVKGAFTDAHDDRRGRFELASGGTLFLDEIGNVPMALQQKLLSALQNRIIYRVGASAPIPVNVRFVSATNLNLKELVSNGVFREDLYYRLNTFEITVPPLRERKDDIGLLSDHFIIQYGKRYHKEDIKLSREALKMMKKYHWPGNIRELEHTMERAIILTEDSIIKPENVNLGTSPVTVLDHTHSLDTLEKKAIQEALVKYHANMSKIAKELGLGRTTLYRKLKKYGL